MCSIKFSVTHVLTYSFLPQQQDFASENNCGPYYTRLQKKGKMDLFIFPEAPGKN